MSFKILSVGAKEGKAPLVIITALENDKRKKYVISEGTYREIGCPLSGENISEDSLAKISEQDCERRAMAKALTVLAYADNSEARLYTKLRAAGFSQRVANLTKEECIRLGYIDERRQIERIITRSYEEHLGPYKIMYKLCSLGYARSNASLILREMQNDGRIDFKAASVQLVSSLPEDATLSDKQKLLKKYGYIK